MIEGNGETPEVNDYWAIKKISRRSCFRRQLVRKHEDQRRHFDVGMLDATLPVR
jgi:hypothetical protein